MGKKKFVTSKLCKQFYKYKKILNCQYLQLVLLIIFIEDCLKFCLLAGNYKERESQQFKNSLHT